MKKFLCLGTTKKFPDASTGNIYVGDYDEKGNLWILDDFYLNEGVSTECFCIENNGAYVETKNLNKFEEI